MWKQCLRKAVQQLMDIRLKYKIKQTKKTGNGLYERLNLFPLVLGKGVVKGVPCNETNEKFRPTFIPTGDNTVASHKVTRHCL